MNEDDLHPCIDGCGKSIYQLKINHQIFQFEDVEGKIPHTKLRCEINQVVLKQLGQLQIQINQIKVRMKHYDNVVIKK